jgi:quinol monooxygenase YgiN
MRQYLLAAVVSVSGLLGQLTTVLAEETEQQPTYAVAHLEVSTVSVSEARALVMAYSADAAKAPGALRIDALERIGYPNHYALVEQWKSAGAKQAYAATDAALKFRAALGPLQSAAYDERVHTPLSVGPAMPIGAAEPVVILTHVDLIPATAAAGVVKVKEFVEQGRGAPGNRRFDVLTQANRQNHMTVVETWDAAADKNAWISSAAARSFREALQPMSGGLYDERAFKPIR